MNTITGYVVVAIVLAIAALALWRHKLVFSVKYYMFIRDELEFTNGP